MSHLMAPKTHGWKKTPAKSARNNFGLNKLRPYKPDHLRKTVKRKRRTDKFVCPMKYCFKELTRINNHLRQTHGKKDKEEVDRLAAKAIPVKPLPEIALSSSSEDEEEEQQHTDDASYTPFFETFNSEDDDDDYIEVGNRNRNTKDDLEQDDDSEHENEEENESADEEEEDEDDRFVMSSKEEDNVMADFIDFLVSVDGGYKALRCAKRHSKVVMSIVRNNNDCVDYYNLTKREFLVNWIDNFGGKSGTTKTYLGSLKHFFNFCTAQKRDLIDLKQVVRISTLIDQWKRNLWKQIRRSKYDKDLSDLEKMPKLDDLTKFDNSAHVKQAVSTLNMLIATEVIGKLDFCLVRDYMLTTLITDNSTRPGALANMTLREFRKSKKEKEAFVIGVRKHKTDYNGPAFISISFNLMKYMRKYMVCRNQLPGIGNRDHDPVFVSWSGSSMTSNMINIQFQRFWKNAVGESATITSTLMRKFTTTVVHEKYPELKRKTANLLCHSERTATENYALIQKSKSVASTSCELRRALRSNSTSTGRLDTDIKKHFQDEIINGSVNIALVREKMANNKELCGMTDKQIVDRIRYLSKTTERPDVEEDVELPEYVEDPDYVEHPEDVEPPEDVERPYMKSNKRKRINYTTTDVNLLRKHLSQFIKGKKSLIKSELTSFIKNCPELQELLENKGIASLLIKVRTERDRQ